jgi:hypothetical protein
MIDEDDAEKIDPRIVTFPCSFERVLRIICTKSFGSIEEVSRVDM